MNPLKKLFNRSKPTDASVMTVALSGTKVWYRNGDVHREDGPAIEYVDGTKMWYRNGLRHREDGPAIEWADGDKLWYRNDQRHREDGPAVERADGSREWYRNDQRHREDGAAVERADGSREWWLKGELVKTEPAKFNEITLRQASALATVPRNLSKTAVPRQGFNL